MPLRYMNRDQGMLMPPDLDEWVAQDHPVRFVAAFVVLLLSINVLTN